MRSYLLVLSGAVLLSTAVGLEKNDIQDSPDNHSNELEEANGHEVQHWPWPRFRCPTAWGAYPDPGNCAFFYICVAKIATRTRCPLMYHFCKKRRVCLPMLVAVCNEGSNEGSGEVTRNEETTTEADTEFVCPEERGKFPYPHDCRKYYSCKHDEATLETCKDSQLFDGVKGRCRDAKKVHCGSRLRPTDIPPYENKDHTSDETETTDEEPKETTPVEEPTSQEEQSTPHEEETTTVEEGTTPQEETTTQEEETTPVEEEITTAEEETTTVEEETTTVDEETTTIEEETTTVDEETTTVEEETTTAEDETTTAEDETTTVEEETTTKVRVTAPDTTCDVDDLDCIIDDLGETPSWFVCPDDLGSYPHPTSKKLFIFCLNWKPSVKKCGQDLVFSEDHMTCVSPY